MYDLRSTLFDEHTLQLLQVAPQYAQYVPDNDTRSRIGEQITNYLRQYVRVLTDTEVASLN